MEILCAQGHRSVAEERTHREWKFSSSVNSGSLLAVRDDPRRTAARFRIYGAGRRGHDAEGFRPWGISLLGPFGLAGSDARRLSLQQPRMGAEGRISHASMGRDATAGELLRSDRPRAETRR